MLVMRGRREEFVMGVGEVIERLGWIPFGFFLNLVPMS